MSDTKKRPTFKVWTIMSGDRCTGVAYPADCDPVCDRCGSYLRGFGRGECKACADEFLADEAFIAFYEWEPESGAAERDDGDD